MIRLKFKCKLGRLGEIILYPSPEQLEWAKANPSICIIKEEDFQEKKKTTIGKRGRKGINRNPPGQQVIYEKDKDCPFDMDDNLYEIKTF